MSKLRILSAASTKLTEIKFPKMKQLKEIYLMNTSIEIMTTVNISCAEIISVSYTKLTVFDATPLT